MSGDPRDPTHPGAPYDLTRDAHGHGCVARDLDGVARAFSPVIRDDLRARGLLTLDADGVWQLRSHGDDVVGETRAVAVCDFCGASPAGWRCPCGDFTMPDGSEVGRQARPLQWPASRSTGAWAACDACAALVTAGQTSFRARRRLLERCLEVHREAGRGHAALMGTRFTRDLARGMEALQRAIHTAFWTHSLGAPVRTGEPPDPPR